MKLPNVTVLVTLLLLLGATSADASQTPREGAPLIVHTPTACVPQEEFPVVAARIEGASELRSVKIYFRSNLYPDFYFVEMKLHEDIHVGVLPEPDDETDAVVYYIEALNGSFVSVRSGEYVVPVRDPCSERRDALAYLGEDGGIVVGSASSGASSLPPGFKVIGIVGTVTAAGVLSSLGGGVGAGTLVAAGAVAGGAAGAVIVATGPESSTSSPSTSTAPLGSGGPSSSTSTIPPASSTVGPATSTVGTTTTSVVGGSATSTVGASTTTTAAPATTSAGSSTTTVGPTTTIPPPTACFEVANLGFCTLRLDASCSTGIIDSFEWRLDNQGQLGSPVARTGQVVTHDYAALCLLSQVENVLTVRGPGGTDTATATYQFLLQRGEEPPGARLLTFISAEDATAVGTVRINDRVLPPLSGAGSATVTFAGRTGTNVVEASTTALRGEGAWTFDFGSTERFRAGSLVVDQGEVTALTGTRVVFRIPGKSSIPVRFRFELAPR